MSNGIKVTDRRLFNEDGELREEYRHLDKGERGEESDTKEQEGETVAAEAVPPSSSAEAGGSAAEGSQARPTAGEGAESLPAPGFLDLVGILAEPARVYLGEVRVAEGENLENPSLARFYIDLLDLLREKTTGNLTDAERSILEDLIYHLRLRYVDKQQS